MFSELFYRIKYLLLIAIPIVLIFFMAIIWIIFNDSKQKQYENIAKNSEAFEVLAAFSHEKLKKRWKLGDYDSTLGTIKDKCNHELGNLQNTDLDFLRCNPNYLQCIFEQNNEIPFQYQGKLYQVLIHNTFPPKTIYSNKNRFYEIITPRPINASGILHNAITLNISLKKAAQFPVKIVLINKCNTSYLPQKQYAYGVYNRDEKDWIWDNFNRHIYVDKYLVTNRDIYEWKAYGKNSSNIKLPASKNMSSPSTTLSREEMKQYCAFRKKHLLEARISDAVNFFTLDIPISTNIFRGKYPWPRKSMSALLKEKKTSTDFCQKIYSKDCTKILPYMNFSSTSSTWIEINQAMGGPIEYLENKIDPNKNLNLSSYYFKRDKPWHQIGLRGEWNKSFLRKQFGNFEKIDIAFRCMSFTKERIK